MKRQWGFWPLALGLAVLVFSGCTTYPVAKELRTQAKPVTWMEAKENPASSRGTIVVWGGKIINCLNDTNGGSVYVLKLPLAKNEKPLADAESAGRFIARSGKFLDPEIYQRGQLVTVAGSLDGLKTETVQKTSYDYPVVAVKQIHVWPVEPEVNYYFYPAWGWYGPGWYWDGYPGWTTPYYNPRPPPRNWSHPPHGPGYGGRQRHGP